MTNYALDSWLLIESLLLYSDKVGDSKGKLAEFTVLTGYTQRQTFQSPLP